ncbi:hypothetical protein JL720_4689 [Aureococcus anophagefferens]|nr:hypothetical protein JL720_4689 [Aureococcus anophagefferens]
MSASSIKQLVVDLQKASAPTTINDILKALTAAKVTVAMLHEFKCGAVVSKLRKHEDAGVSASAKALIKKWKELAAAAGVPSTPRAPGSSPREGQASSTAETAAGFEVADLGDAVRQSSRKKLLERDYVAKLRQLSFNLKKNPDLRARVAGGGVTPAELCSMSVDELATQEVQAERKKMAEFQHDARSLDWDKKNRDRVDGPQHIRLPFKRDLNTAAHASPGTSDAPPTP